MKISRRGSGRVYALAVTALVTLYAGAAHTNTTVAADKPMHELTLVGDRLVDQDGRSWPVRTTVTDRAVAASGTARVRTISMQAIPATEATSDTLSASDTLEGAETVSPSEALDGSSPLAESGAAAAPAAVPAGSDGIRDTCEKNPSYVVTQCITMYYDYDEDGAERYAAVDKYTASWTRLDSAFTMKKGVIRAGVMGRCAKNCSGFLSEVKTHTVNNPVNGRVYSYNPPWRGKFVLVSSTGWFQCGIASVNYQRSGGSTGSAISSSVCEGSTPSSFG